MDTELAFINTLLQDPNDDMSRMVFADWLEERGDPRAELIRLTNTLTQSIDIPNRPELEARLRTLLEQGVQPIGPFWTNDLGMKFAWIPSGTFLMGSGPKEEKEWYDPEVHDLGYYDDGSYDDGTYDDEAHVDETQHTVTLTKGFFMGVHLITQEQWKEIMGNKNPSRSKGKKNLPVDAAFWDNCQEFIKKLRKKDKKLYRLPTEAEWEYACRAGTTTPFYFGETISTYQANYMGGAVYGDGKKGIFREGTTPVGSFPANGWGLHDMHGNVWESCQDLYGDYPKKDVVDPLGPSKGKYRVLRGGSWFNTPQDCRSAYRLRHESDHRSGGIYGLRVCYSVD